MVAKAKPVKSKPLPKEPDEPEYKVETYWVDTGWGCGAMEVCGGIVVSGAPIFRRFRGQSFETITRRYKVRPCADARAVRA